MKALKSARTLAASLGVLAVGALAATPAMAFDKVDWDWEKDIHEEVDIDADIDLDVDITGMVEVEKLQIFLGTVNAESKVHDLTNNQYDRDNYFDSLFIKDGYEIPTAYHGLEFIFCICKVDGCDVDEIAFDATIDLPSVVSAATAVGNNQSITSDVPVFLHDGQFVANTLDNYYDYDTLKAAMPASLSGGDGGYNAGNLHTDLAILFTLASGFGLLTPAEITATSTVYNIKNATVDSSATAVANNLSVTLESDVAGTGGDALKTSTICIPSYSNNWCGGGNHDGGDALLSNHVVIADITQFAYANVSAVSNVCDVEINEYTNLSPDTEVLGRPLVNSVATAVGNNVSITVGVPTPDVE
jgi:hypothetical protein